ncbi:hypothetical protein BJ878DRAFT_220938 [Calycina marina]|uniref:Zinc finger PHD-type domain-containing protein n=1 Tax=Calycina marina TaxID=1763456 RepID=A0A9P7YX11_9HELO|nr:hypothetical protein BJ878DRAFT_220938 [Calycina marina]
MSLTHKGAGEAAFERYISLKRQKPFLDRNIRKALLSLTMGMAVSRLARSTGKLRQKEDEVNACDIFQKDHADEEEEGDEADEGRPAKRRRLNAAGAATPGFAVSQHRFLSESPRRNPFGVVRESHNRPIAGGISKPIEPSLFYGKVAAKPFELKNTRSKFRGAIDNRLPDDPVSFQRALRIDVTDIRLNAPGRESYNFMGKIDGVKVDIKCRCEVSIHYNNNDGKTPDTELYRVTKTCILRVKHIGDGVISREVLYLEPFIVGVDQIYVKRKMTAGTGTIERTFELADKYFIEVKLIAIKPRNTWPPFDLPLAAESDESENPGPSMDPGVVTDLVDIGQADKLDLYLFGMMIEAKRPENQRGPVDLSLCWDRQVQPMKSKALDTKYVLGVTVRWSIPKSFKGDFDRPVAEKMDVDEAVQPAPSPSLRKGTGLLKGLDVDFNPDGRGRGSRAVKPSTYNLKTLSARAQGKSPKKAWTANPAHSPDVSVCFEFSQPDAAGYGVKSKSTVSGLICPFCSRRQPTLDDLRVHLHNSHINFKFTLTSKDPRRPRFSVELASRKGCGLSHKMLLQQTFQLGRPRTLFDLNRYLTGDDSWLKAREGPLHGHFADHLTGTVIDHDSSAPTSPFWSRQSSPNTSTYNDPETPLPKISRKKHIVPKAVEGKPLYDTISKRTLVPGEEVPSSDDEKNENWLNQKHRDIILEYDDVTADEKDYILRWNPFVMQKHITSEYYLPHTILAFVHADLQWFGEKRSRIEMFSRQCETFILRGVLKQKCYMEALELLRNASLKKSGAIDVDKDQRAAPAGIRRVFECVCGQVTQPADRILCHAEDCKNRYFHRECAKKDGRNLKGWFCDECIW